MNTTIQLPELLARELYGYAKGADLTPEQLLEQAWDEFRARHPRPVKTRDNTGFSQELKDRVRALRGSIQLPVGKPETSLTMLTVPCLP